MNFLFLFLMIFFSTPYLSSWEPSPAKVKALYNSLDPQSISEHLAFYELYANYPEGQQALLAAYCLLTGQREAHFTAADSLPSLVSAIDAIVALVNKPPDTACFELNDSELQVIERLAGRLPNRHLKGYWVKTEEEVLALPPEEIDLSRGVLLTQLGNDPRAMNKVRSYESLIDLMALQILARTSLSSSPEIKIRAINRFIFEDMGFRFPPHSLYAKDVDLYTFLPSVLDSRKGVCLGVSILYLSLAQRLNLNLEMITPPGHIFVRYCNGEDQIINIETTARGVHLDTEQYLGIDTCALQQRNIKEVIGLAHFNQASIYWEKKKYQTALESYLKAIKYLPNDPLLQELMAYTYLLTGYKDKGEELLKKTSGHHSQFTIARDSLSEDYLNGLVGVEGIEAMFIHVDEKRESVVAKRKALEEILSKYPRFRAGLFSLAGAWLQLHRDGEALEILKRYHEIDSSNPTVEYFLAVIYFQRFDFNKAWEHLKLVEKILEEHQHHPEALGEFRRELAKKYPE